MEQLRTMRQASGLSQIALARRAHVSRMRLQLAEAGEITLRPSEVEAVKQTLREALKDRADALHSALVNSGPLHTTA